MLKHLYFLLFLLGSFNQLNAQKIYLDSLFTENETFEIFNGTLKLLESEGTSEQKKVGISIKQERKKLTERFVGRFNEAFSEKEQAIIAKIIQIQGYDFSPSMKPAKPLTKEQEQAYLSLIKENTFLLVNMYRYLSDCKRQAGEGLYKIIEPFID